MKPSENVEPVRHQAEKMELLTFVDRCTDGMDVRLVHVTPYEAAYVIKHRNPHNRTVRPLDVRSMSLDMRKNHWPTNGETVKFADNGWQLDGQHRFTALAAVPHLNLTNEEAAELSPLPDDFSLPFLVVAGLDVSTQDTMDVGAKRTHADVLKLRGVTNGPLLASVVRKIWQWESGDVHFRGNARFSVPEMLEFIKSHPRALRSTEIANRVRTTFRAIPPSVVGVAHYVFAEIDNETAPWFFQHLADGADLHKGHPVLTLRESLFSIRNEQRSARRYQNHDMAMLVRVWNAVRKGQDLTRIYGLSSDGSMPMPI